MIDQTACENYRALVVRQIAERKDVRLGFVRILMPYIALKLGFAGSYRFANTRKNDNVAGDEGERVASLVAAYRDAVRKKREHTPVYQVGAVPLGGVFAGDVRAAAENSLAGRRLLACASVTGTARRHKRRITDRALERKRLLCRFNACGGRVSLVSGQVGIAVDPGFAVARELSYRGAENVGAVNVIGIASRQGETGRAGRDLSGRMRFRRRG